MADYTYRWYDPVTGRWPSRDSIEERGGMNLYNFVHNDAVSFIDIIGKQDYYVSDNGIGNIPQLPQYSVDVSDGLSYVEGADQYFGGNGDPLNIPFSSIDPGWGFYDFPAESLPRTYGDHPYSSSKVTELLWDGRSGNGGPGQVNIILEGTINVFCEDESGKDKWKFEGKVYAPPNRFDFNPANRGFPREQVTTVIRNVGPLLGGDNFTMEFTGERRVTEEDYVD